MIKNTLWKRYLTGCLLVLLTCFCFITVQAETELEATVRMDMASGELLPKARVTGSRSGRMMLMTVEDFYYESQLDTANQRAIYHALENAGNLTAYKKENRLTCILAERVDFAEGVTTSNYSEDPGYLSAYCDFAKATHAYIKDHVEEYWISAFTFSITTTDVRNGYITQIRLYPKQYYDNILEELEETNQKLAACAAKVQGNTIYEKVKYIHDAICAQITYPNTNAGYYHTVPCAWLENYGYEGVCEAYAKSFACVCRLAGIEVLTVTGGSRESGGVVVADHMWNYVKMDDGQWYLVDCTWDDSKTGKTKYDYFLAGNKECAMNHIPVGCFSADGTPAYTPFAYPALAEEGYQAVLTFVAEEQLSFHAGEQMAVSVSCLPENAKRGTTLIYESSDLTVAEISDQGIITTKAGGEAVITIRSEAYPTINTSCTITVSPHDFSIEKEAELQTCSQDGRKLMECSYDDCHATEEVILPADGESHEASDAWVMTAAPTCVAEGVEAIQCMYCEHVLEERALPIDAEAHSAGAWKVKTAATCLKTGLKVKCCTLCQKQLNQKTIAKTKATVALNVKKLPLQLGTTTSVLKIKEKDPIDRVSKWKSLDPKIVAVDQATGKLTGKKLGTATIKLQMASGATATCTVTVKKQVKTTSLTLGSTSVKLNKNKTYQIKPVRYPLTALDPIYYVSSNPKIATVSKKGVVKGIKKGTVTIQVYTTKKVAAQLIVKVK